MPRGGTNYIPRPDGDFAAFADQYFLAVKTWWVDRGLNVDDLTALDEALTAWNAAYPAHVQAAAEAAGARRAKDAARADLERAIRPITNFVQSYPQTTNADRAAIGITVRPAATGRGSRPAPTTAPRMVVDIPARLTHTLRLVGAGPVDAAGSGRSARPRGVDRAEVFVALTPPSQPAPPPPSSDGGGGGGGADGAGAYRYIGSVTRGETTLSFEADKGGLQAHYLSRWVSTSGAAGPWSETTSATVAA